jgi:hypothetical protein
MFKNNNEIKKNLRVKKITILVFIWSAFLFFLGLQYDFLDIYDLLIFWCAILLMIGVVIYQIFFFTNKTFILFEIFFIYLFLHLIFVFGYYGLHGSDSYYDYGIFKEILNTNKFILKSGVNGYPILHIFSSIIYFFTNINTMLIAKFLPSLISSLIVFPIYLVGVKIYHDERIALLSSLIFGTIPQFMSFDSNYVREIFGLFMMILFFYFIGTSIRVKFSSYYLMVFILIPIIIISHHLSSFLFLFLMITYLIVSFVLLYFNKIMKYVKSKIQIMGIDQAKINYRLLLIVILFSISLLAYWFYVYGIDLVGLLESFILDALGIRNSPSGGGTYAEAINLGAPIITVKGKIIYYGFFFFVFLFSILLIIKIFIKIIYNKIEDSTFIIFYFFSMALGFSTLFLISGAVIPDRFLPFAFLFGLLPLTDFILVLKKNIGKKIITIILISFIVFNLYNIDTHNYTYNASFTEGAVKEGEYLIANHISFPKKYYGYIAVVAAIYDIQGIEQRAGGMDLSFIKIPDFRNSSSMAVINEAQYDNDLINLQQKSPKSYSGLVELLSLKNDINVDKICDFGRIYVIKGGG